MRSRIRDRSKFRKGYTTGTCAAGAARAAVKSLLGIESGEVEIELPSGKSVSLQIHSKGKGNGSAWCCIKKDAGDDPDITNGTLICARANGKDGSGIIITCGEGVGRVTKPGLKVPVGQGAINPVPREMIEKNVMELLKTIPGKKGVKIQIYVPEGERLAKKTLNHKLGIHGGISIIGTTGIVEPWSDEAFMRSLAPQIDMAMAAGHEILVLTPGNIGEKHAVRMGFPEDSVVQMGNYVGFILGECVKKEISEAIIFGSQGKVIKIAGGIFNTHSRIADARLEILAANVAVMGGNKDIINRIMESSSAEEASGIIKEEGRMEIYNLIARKASNRAMEYTGHEMKIGTAILSNNGDMLGYDLEAMENPEFIRIIKGG